jgi:purine-binding chemotaxis protein CheW
VITIRSQAQEAGSQMELQLATFYLDNIRFGIDLLEIQEINRQRDLTPVPHTAQHVRGVINLRGEVVSVLDLRAMLGLGEFEITSGTRNIILHSGGEPVGVLVDCLSDVVSLTSGELQALPANTSGLDARFMVGVHQLETELVVVLRMEELFAPKDGATTSA